MKNNRSIIKIFLILFFISFINCFAQTDWKKWTKVDFSYAMPEPYRHRDYSLNFDDAEQTLLKSLANIYWYFISEVDGDNCRFTPTCSNFFLQAVEQTNLIQGTLMFADRFTRDMNIFKSRSGYPFSKSGYLFDPPAMYTLDKNNIKYIPPSSVVIK